MALVFGILTVFASNLLSLATPYLNFAGAQGSNAVSLPFTITTCLAPNPILTSMTVMFQAVGGSGKCVPGQCYGTAASVFETFSTPASPFALFSAPSNPATTVTYWLQGQQVGPIQGRLGGMYELPKSAHTVFDTVEFSW